MTIPKSAKTLVTATISGVLLYLSFPDSQFWPLTFVSLTPLLMVAPRLGPWRAFGAGWLAGTVAHSLIFWWIHHTAMAMGGFPYLAALGVWALFAVVSGLIFGVEMLGIRLVLGHDGLRGPLGVLAVGGVVAGTEIVWPQLFPWFLGSGWFRAPVLLQGVDLTGVQGMSFLAAAGAAALAVSIRATVNGERTWYRLRDMVLVLVLMMVWVGYGLYRLDDVKKRQASAPTVRIAIVQPNIDPRERRNRSKADEIVSGLIEMVKSADLTGVSAVVFPEGSFPHSYAPDSKQPGWEALSARSRRMSSLAKEIGVDVILGATTRPRSQARNSMILIDKNGNTKSVYDKRVLLAFGETMPFADVLPILRKVPGVGNLEAGKVPQVFDIGGTKALASICYEAIKARNVRQDVVDLKPDWILNITNDGWFGKIGAPGQHLMIQVPRAVEHRIPLVRATQTGISVVVAADGEFLLETKLNESGVYIVDVPLPSGQFSVYSKVGDLFAWACLIAMLAMGLTRVFSRRTSRQREEMALDKDGKTKDRLQ